MAKTVIYQLEEGQEPKAFVLDVSPTQDARIQVAMIDNMGNSMGYGMLTLPNWGKLCRAVNYELDLVAE